MEEVVSEFLKKYFGCSAIFLTIWWSNLLGEHVPGKVKSQHRLSKDETLGAAVVAPLMIEDLCIIHRHQAYQGGEYGTYHKHINSPHRAS